MLTAISVLFLSLFASAGEVRDTNAAPAVQQESTKPKADETRSCGELTDDACSKLWSPKNKGKMKLADGEVLAGKSRKSGTSLAKLADLNALLESESKLPADLQRALSKPFKKLRSVLDREKDSTAWYRELSMAEYEIGNAIDDVAKVRTERRNPELKKIKAQDLTFDQRTLYAADEYAISTELMDAKYAQSENWKRVESTFKKVKTDLAKAISELPVSAERKSQMLAKINGSELTLPYRDPNKLGADQACSTTENNAFYQPVTSKFTVCAGLFNSYQSESALYIVIAHELGHSIDASRYANDLQQSKSELTRALAPIAKSSAAPLTCEQWDTVKATARTVKPAAKPNVDVLQSLYDCIQPKTGLAEYDAGRLEQIAGGQTTQTISSFAEADVFLNLAQPTFSKNGKIKPNEYYMRPDRLIARNRGYVPETRNRWFPNIYETFNQALACESVELNGKIIKYADAPKSIRAIIFEQAINTTAAIDVADSIDTYNYCGTNCSGLQSSKMAKSPDENYADWIAYRAFGNYLARAESVDTRRELSAAATVFFCESPGVANDAPDLAAVQKKASLEPHPDPRIRRLSLFNSRNAELTKCTISKNEQGFSQCQP